jgi:hypothetical protein
VERKQLRRNRRIAIADRLAAIMRRAEPTPFSLEGPLRAGVRAALCLAGWRWPAADAEARILTLRALQLVGAKRPRWIEGQPEYTQPGVRPPPRETCARCAKPLPEENYRYCSSVCARAAYLDRARNRDREELNAKRKAYLVAWSERQPARECKACGRSFQPKRNDSATLCSNACRDDWNRTHLRRPAEEARGADGRGLRMVCEAVRTEDVESDLL